MKASREIRALSDGIDRLRATLGVHDDEIDPHPSRWAAGAMGVALDDWQAEIMDADARQICVIAARQSGKSSVTAARAAYAAAKTPGQRIVLVSPTFRQSSALRSKVLGCLISAKVRHEQNREEIRLLNGSTIRALPGDDPDKVRGATADLVIVDEAAFIKDNVAAAVLPMLASTGGDLIAVSTPNGPNGLFHDMATDADTLTIEVPASRITRFDEETIASLRIRLGPARASQELDCAFVASTRSVFDADALATMFGDPPAPPDLDAFFEAADEEKAKEDYTRASAERNRKRAEKAEQNRYLEGLI